jgi:hypothetical protein
MGAAEAAKFIDVCATASFCPGGDVVCLKMRRLVAAHSATLFLAKSKRNIMRKVLFIVGALPDV